ncbi:MAG: LptA/OstA family protein [Pseudomonadota bacterium]
MMIDRVLLGLGVMVLVAAPAAWAQGPAAGQSDKPIEVSSDKLDVFQDQNKAVFTGNVIAVQGTSNLRSKVMTVFYRQDSAPKADAPAVAKPAEAPPPGIYRIEAEQDVVFTTPTEAATGDTGIYDVDADTIDILGKTVILTRGQNVLKGTKMTYNMTTGRSILTAGSGGASDVTATGAAKPARVHGLFLTKPAASPTDKK